MEFIPDQKQFARIQFLENSLMMLAGADLVLYVDNDVLKVAPKSSWQDQHLCPLIQGIGIRDQIGTFKGVLR